MLSKMARGLALVTLAFILILPISAPAKMISGDTALVSELSKAQVDGSEALKSIKKDLNLVKNDYTKENSAQITWGNPADYTQMGDEFFIISFDATIFFPNPKTAIFSLLYEREKSNELQYAKSYLSWVGPSEIKGFNSLSSNALCSLFENQTGKTICQPEPEVADDSGSQVFASEMGAKIEDLEIKLQQQLSQTAAKTHTHNASDITEGVLKEALIDDAICRDNELSKAVAALTQEINKRPLPDTEAEDKAAAEAQLDLTDKSTEIEALKAQISELQNTVMQLAAILEGVNREGSDLIFSGMNVYVVSGSGATDATPNGLGNLIVGYNESDKKNKINTNGGSHNIVVGKNQTYTSYGGFVAGASNRISAPYATISGGFNSIAGGAYSSVSGGQLNTASGDYATVSGGLARKAEGNNNWSAGDQTSGK